LLKGIGVCPIELRRRTRAPVMKRDTESLLAATATKAPDDLRSSVRREVRSGTTCDVDDRVIDAADLELLVEYIGSSPGSGYRPPPLAVGCRGNRSDEFGTLQPGSALMCSSSRVARHTISVLRQVQISLAAGREVLVNNVEIT